jgi:hypothetical protein
MTTARRFVANALIAFVVSGSLACVVLDVEAWPFSNYPMYSDLSHGEFGSVRMYGRTARGEVGLSKYSHWFPLGALRVARAVKNIENTEGADVLQTSVMKHLWEHYEGGRLAGRHDGPGISALLAYELTWRIESGAANRDVPDSRRRIASYQHDGSS